MIDDQRYTKQDVVTETYW